MSLRMDHEKLSKILKDFYTLSHIRIVIYDSRFQRVAAYPAQSSDFCHMLEQNPTFKALCRQNEAEACRYCSQKNSLYTYSCHSGLTETVAPIKMNDLILGYIMFGQILNTKSDEQAILKYASGFISDKALIKKHFNNLKIRDDEQVTAIAGIMQACTSYLWISEIIKIEGENGIYFLTDYINRNLNEDLSVDTLCSAFKLSRVRLYEMAHEYYGMSIAKYIRQKRISEAAKLLRESGCSVREAAINVGFYDYNYFSKAFKREMRMTPNEYKRINFDKR